MVDAVHVGDPVVFELEIAAILQPLNAVERLPQIGLVQNVAVGVKDVELAVAIHVHQLDAAAAPARMRGGIERLLRELSTALVDEGDHRLVLLSDERDEIRLAVAVEIGDRHVDRAVSLVDHAGTNSGLAQFVVWFSRRRISPVS